MKVPIPDLVREFVQEARVPEDTQSDVFLQALLDDFKSSPAMFKRDMRRMLEKDPGGFLKSACRTLKAASDGPGAEYLMELLWSNPVMIASLVDPALLPIKSAIGLAQRWAPYDPLLDIKLLHIGFPSDSAAVCDIDIIRANRVLAIVNELPARRHILLPLAGLLHSPDPKVRSKATTLYGRTSQNADWVRKKLAEPDARVRANAVETLWGSESANSKSVLREAVRDPNHRVAANALIGLHQTGGYDVVGCLEKMAKRADPMARAAAAFAMGRIQAPELKPLLENLLKDGNAQVRGQALRSLVRIKRRAPRDAGEAAAAPAPAEVPDAAKTIEQAPVPDDKP